jgi:hypothetical protein
MTKLSVVGSDIGNNSTRWALQLRLDAIREALRRGRMALLTSMVAALAILVAAWNAYLSWYSYFPLDLRNWSAQDPTAAAQRELVAEWVRSQTIGIGVLGIRVGISDGAVLGSVALFFITIWLYFSLRRVNRAVSAILIETLDEPVDVRRVVLHGVVAHLVFMDLGTGDEPIRDLDATRINPHSYTSARFAFRSFFFLAPAAIWIVLVMDLLTVFVLRAPFRGDHQPLIHALNSAPVSTSIQLVLMELTALILAIQTTITSTKALQFEVATAAVIKEYSQRVDKDTLAVTHRRSLTVA